MGEEGIGMIAREELHELVERLPESELTAARSYLRYLATVGSDPVLRALMNAPLDDEPLTEEELEAIEEGRRDLAEGRVVSHEEARRRLLG
jgi:predicted transcriptional regulator